MMTTITSYYATVRALVALGTGRIEDIARRAGVSKPTAKKRLDKMVELGVATHEKVCSISWWTVNPRLVKKQKRP